MYNDQLVYRVVIWVFFGISLWKEKIALTSLAKPLLIGHNVVYIKLAGYSSYLMT